MINKERIIIRYLGQRWYKKTLIVTTEKQEYFNRIHTLKLVVCSGYLEIQQPIGCVFDIDAWPFDHKYFDLIILDDAINEDSKKMNGLLSQLHFSLAEDGEVVVVSTQNTRLYKLISKFLANGFITKRLRLINYTNNFIVNFIKRIISKNFVVVFKKDNFFTATHLNVEELVKKPIKSKVYNSGCAKEIYGTFQEKRK